MKCNESYGLEVVQLIELIALTVIFRVMIQPKKEWQELFILALAAIIVSTANN